MSRKEAAVNMNKRILLLILIILLLFFAGCSDDGANGQAPAQTPITEQPTESEPEPATGSAPGSECNHFWRNPTCFYPYICMDCEETEGSPLEHELTAANFQVAPECVHCGETVGEPVEPHFVGHGLRINTTSGRPFDYRTITSLDSTIVTIGVAALLYIDMFESDFEYPSKAGYEYIKARFLINFEDENARTSGFQYLTGQLDFFGFDPNEAAVIFNELADSDIPGFKIAGSTLNYFGEDYEYYMKHTQVQNEWVGNKSYIVFEYTFLAPAGYDGLVVYISNAANWSDAAGRVLSDNFDSDTLFFRLRAQTN